eukprot:CAMPEP_0182881092 /NCGR_PEP_ID=MMETSP0034_2-20130328/16972_1 /TAXON_ID=156128 /ORGANISM="Nephroselmis pyriformis, Strain CCMP717" /LENGTH=119 /DNA_ID=CAMNT_0025014113 /DNA_START=92 /DNA_END=447 /DNA_ORIENTATION=+
MADLHTALKAFRLREARKIDKPAFCVFSNKELDGLVAACPCSENELLRCKGFGAQKVSKYGAGILRICNMFGRGHAPAPAPVSSYPTAPASYGRRTTEATWIALLEGAGRGVGGSAGGG